MKKTNCVVVSIVSTVGEIPFTYADHKNCMVDTNPVVLTGIDDKSDNSEFLKDRKGFITNLFSVITVNGEAINIDDDTIKVVADSVEEIPFDDSFFINVGLCEIHFGRKEWIEFVDDEVVTNFDFPRILMMEFESKEGTVSLNTDLGYLNITKKLTTFSELIYSGVSEEEGFAYINGLIDNIKFAPEWNVEYDESTYPNTVEALSKFPKDVMRTTLTHGKKFEYKTDNFTIGVKLLTETQWNDYKAMA